jgi:hypothetical protein
MLDDCMERNQNISEEEANKLGESYLEVLEVAHHIFGKRVFRLKDSKGKLDLSIPLYDGIMIALVRLWKDRERLVEKKVEVVRRVEKLVQDAEAYEVIVGRPNTSTAIKDRLRILTEAVGG